MNRDYDVVLIGALLVAFFVAGVVIGDAAAPQPVIREAASVQEGYVSGKSSGYVNGWLSHSVIIKLDYAAEPATVSVTSGYFDQIKISERVKVTYTQQGWVIVEAP